MADMHVRRSLLFVPANRPQLFAKALSGPADMVCIELEDGVGPDQKQTARAHMLSFFEQTDTFSQARPEVVVRINHPDTDEGKADLQAISLRSRFPPGDDPQNQLS